MVLTDLSSTATLIKNMDDNQYLDNHHDRRSLNIMKIDLNLIFPSASSIENNAGNVSNEITDMILSDKNNNNIENDEEEGDVFKDADDNFSHKNTEKINDFSYQNDKTSFLGQDENEQPKSVCTFNNDIRLRQISVSKCFDDSIDFNKITSPTTTTNSTINTLSNATSKTESATIRVNSNNFKYKHNFLGTYCTLRRSRRSSSSGASSFSSSRSVSPICSSSSSFGSSLMISSSKNPIQNQIKRNRTKKMKLSVPVTDQNTETLSINEGSVNNNNNKNVSNINSANMKLVRLAKKIVSKSSARYSRFSKLRKSAFLTNLNMKKDEETRLTNTILTRKCASSTFSITNNLNTRRIKCLIVGDPCIGKSTLMCLYLKCIFQNEYHPTIVDDFEGTLY
jgi:hypothetical protein